MRALRNNQTLTGMQPSGQNPRPFLIKRGRCHFPEVLNMELAYEPATPLSRHIPKRNENICPHKCLFMVALFIIAKKWAQSKCAPADEWINKMCVSIQQNNSSTIKRNEVLMHATT